MTDEGKQRHLHDVLVAAMREIGYLDDGEILSGWHLAFEKVHAGERPSAGSFYGPESMTTWRAIGLVEWANRFCLSCGDDEDDE